MIKINNIGLISKKSLINVKKFLQCGKITHLIGTLLQEVIINLMIRNLIFQDDIQLISKFKGAEYEEEKMEPIQE